MALDAESLYRHVGRLLEEMPAFWGTGPLPDDVHRWLGRADALVSESSDLRNSIDFRAAVSGLSDVLLRFGAYERIKQVLYRVLAAAELRAPAGVKGTFIPVGSAFDAFAAVSKVLQTGKRDVFIVDPYMDEAVLTEFGQAVPAGIPLRLLADEKDHKPTLAPAGQKWAAQYGAARPLAVRLAPTRALHDRAIFIDGSIAWTLTQSLKDFAKRSPAEIIRADETAALKIAAYESVWTTAKAVV